jgi:hypothetical protein
MILLQNDVGNACPLGFARAMQYLSKFQNICYGAHAHPQTNFFFILTFESLPTHPPTNPHYPP